MRTGKSTCEYAAIFVSRVFSSPPNLQQQHADEDPTADLIRSTLWVGLAVTVLTLIASICTGNHSQVDKLWSILPPVYSILLAKTPRTVLMSMLATLWGLRLTANFARRGGYVFPRVWDGEEDYRWSYVRHGYSMVPYLHVAWVWHIFNALFISLYQNILLWWIAMPSLIVYIDETECHGDRRLNNVDWCLAVLFIALVVVETLADNQQYAFQTEKYRRQALLKDDHDPSSRQLTGHYRDGFCQTGLFALVRKPNYAAEQGIWLIYYAFSVKWPSSSSWLLSSWSLSSTLAFDWTILFNWSFLGWLQLILLFCASSWLTEKITLEKYPVAYARYRAQTPIYIPYLKGFGAQKQKHL
jgi:steroid 5-alpha reductase family enzyme